VGEVLASRSFVEEIKSRFPHHQILMTCTTQTGSATIKTLYGDSVSHQYLPFDLRFFMKRFLKFWNPEITFILETEIWPNLIDLLNKGNKKVFLVNARLSQKSFQGYKKIMPILGNVFSKLTFTVCQGTNDLQRFIDLGIDKNKIKKDFSFKFDSLSAAKKVIKEFKDRKQDSQVIICASTHSPEEKILINAFELLKNEKAILILVPRHPERAHKIYKEMKNFNLEIALFTENNFQIDLSKRINLIDEIGYLEDLFSLADIAFIGGTLIPHGGQNFLEAVRYSLPISSGKSFYNFQEIAEDLINMGILEVGDNAEQLKSIWQNQLNLVSEEISKHTKDYLKQREGASVRTFEYLSL
tara:strand:- start:423 stop:1490 length:1068 start_codon:yes stop_codon:yes gene_type:complete